jgi:hypothetical protein
MKIGKLTYLFFLLFALSLCSMIFLDIYDWKAIVIESINSLSLPAFIVLIFWDIIRFKKSKKLMIVSLILFFSFEVAFSVSELFYYFKHYILKIQVFSIRSILIYTWVILTTLSILLIIRIIIKKQKTKFDDLIIMNELRIIVLFIIILIIMKIPVFDIHPNLGGVLHGHSFWYWSHLH